MDNVLVSPELKRFRSTLTQIFIAQYKSSFVHPQSKIQRGIESASNHVSYLLLEGFVEEAEPSLMKFVPRGLDGFSLDRSH